MNFIIIKPSSALAQYVRFFWLLEGEASIEKPYIHRSVADGCAELIFHYNGIFDEVTTTEKRKKSVTSGLVGPSQRFRRFKINNSFGVFGAYLYPYAIPHLFSTEMLNIKNQVIDLKLLIGKESAELENKISGSTGVYAKVKILSAFLERRISGTKQYKPEIFDAIKSVVQSNGMISVEALAKQNFLSSRQFERVFNNHTGFTPKLFLRITRFQHALKNYNIKGKSLTDIAYDCGYYDQSHFIQEFREFSGYNPHAFFSGQTEATNWRDIQ